MSENVDNTSKRMNMDPRSLTFITPEKTDENQPQMVDGKQVLQQVRKESEFERISKLKQKAVHLYLPKDPAYVPVPEDLLAVNEMQNTMDLSTKVMINVALGDYGAFRKKPEDEDGEPELIKLYFKRVYYEDFEEYQDAQEELNDLNRRILRLEATNGDGTEAGLDKLAQLKKDVKVKITNKIQVGLRVFFKKSEEIRANSKKFDYNDQLFNIEIGAFRYTRAPFLRQIS